MDIINYTIKNIKLIFKLIFVTKIIVFVFEKGFMIFYIQVKIANYFTINLL